MNEDQLKTLSLVPVEPGQQHNPMDAKNKAISDLTASCYQQASQLKLTEAEIKGLSADFPDDAFQPGAAGKENLIYIEHASLRERLDQVIGMGQWCMIPTRRWEEPFKYQKEVWANNRRTGTFEEVTGSHVYVDGIMLIRGAFVASAIGEHTYYPDNHSTNYGDAVESAETAALRRCCKRLGVGLQAWRKDWCAGWWDRRNAKTRQKPLGRVEPPKPPQDTTQTVKTPPTGQSAPKAGTVADPKIGPEYRLKTLNKLQAAPGQHKRPLVHEYLTFKAFILPTEQPEDWPLDKLPKTIPEFVAFCEGLAQFERERLEGRQVAP